MKKRINEYHKFYKSDAGHFTYLGMSIIHGISFMYSYILISVSHKLTLKMRIKKREEIDYLVELY